MGTSLTTAEQYLNMPDTGRSELLRGEIHPLISPGARHGLIAMRLGAWIANHVEDQALGTTYAAETGFLLARDPDTVRGPDVAFVRAERPPCPERGYCEGAPDLVVEVLSSSDRPAYVRDKVAEWLEGGAQLVWVVDPAKRIVATYASDGGEAVLSEHDTLGGGALLPEFEVAVRDIFA